VRMWARKRIRLTAASRAASQGGSSSSSTVCQAKASRLRAASVIARNVRPWAKLHSSSYPWFFSTLEALVLDFPARSAAGDNFGDIETGTLVTQAMEYLTLPFASTISKPIQLTSIASLPSHSGTASIPAVNGTSLSYCGGGLSPRDGRARLRR
jgi:hypothetical protein